MHEKERSCVQIYQGYLKSYFVLTEQNCDVLMVSWIQSWCDNERYPMELSWKIEYVQCYNMYIVRRQNWLLNIFLISSCLYAYVNLQNAVATPGWSPDTNFASISSVTSSIWSPSTLAISHFKTSFASSKEPILIWL